MSHVVAYAQSADSSDSSLMLVVVCAVLIGLSGLLSLIPIRLASTRRHAQREAIVAVTILWALLTAGAIGYTAIQQMNWSKEHLLRIESGYFDPHDQTGAPGQPWLLWAGLAAAYVILLAWASHGGKPLSSKSPP